jgi:hypothetical protein
MRRLFNPFEYVYVSRQACIQELHECLTAIVDEQVAGTASVEAESVALERLLVRLAAMRPENGTRHFCREAVEAASRRTADHAWCGTCRMHTNHRIILALQAFRRALRNSRPARKQILRRRLPPWLHPVNRLIDPHAWVSAEEDRLAAALADRLVRLLLARRTHSATVSRLNSLRDQLRRYTHGLMRKYPQGVAGVILAIATGVARDRLMKDGFAGAEVEEIMALADSTLRAALR